MSRVDSTHRSPQFQSSTSSVDRGFIKLTGTSQNIEIPDVMFPLNNGVVLIKKHVFKKVFNAKIFQFVK